MPSWTSRSKKRRFPTKSSPSRLGPDAERRVRRYYRLRGYRVLSANTRAGGNELDVVARRGQRLVVCEVKARSGTGFGHPWEAVGPEKVRRLERAAAGWLARHPEFGALDVRFEVVAVQGRRIERVPLH
jgi:putative endonuclease